MAAWRFGAPKQLTPAEIRAHSQGLDWPATPLLLEGTAPEFYVLDVAADTPPGSPVSGGSGPAPEARAEPAAAAPDSRGGCQLTPRSRAGAGSSNVAGLFLALAALIVVWRARSWTAFLATMTRAVESASTTRRN